jgi:DNA-binding NtrC family response regulator
MLASNNLDPPEAEPSPLKGMHILLVEDSWQLGIALKNLLQMLGADVAGPVATTAEAERLISEHGPDVALVDVNLRGGEQAYDLIDELHGKGVRVIVTSGYADHPLASQKVVAILQKPISEELLLETLRR